MSQDTLVELRPIGLDSFPALRHIHSLAFRTHLGSDLSEDQLDALVDFVHTPQYVELILQTECLGAWIEDRLCATGSWMPGGSSGANAKLIGVCVDPLFSGLGLGRRLVGEIEARARRAGFVVITARAPVAIAPFFNRLGYFGTSRGVWATPCGVSVPVLHMRNGAAKEVADVVHRPDLGQRSVRAAGLTRLH